MARANVAFDLDCDSCDFSRTVEAESDAYASARDHETDYPNHFVFIYAAE